MTEALTFCDKMYVSTVKKFGVALAEVLDRFFSPFLQGAVHLGSPKYSLELQKEPVKDVAFTQGLLSRGGI